MKTYLSRTQRKLLRSLRAAQKPVSEILNELSLTPLQAARFMKNPYFRREIASISRGLQLVSEWELSRVVSHAIAALLADEKSRGSVALQFLKRVPSGKRVEKPTKRRASLVHPSRTDRADELIKHLSND